MVPALTLLALKLALGQDCAVDISNFAQRKFNQATQLEQTALATYGECYDSCQANPLCRAFSWSMATSDCLTYADNSSYPVGTDASWITGSCNADSTVNSYWASSGLSLQVIDDARFNVGSSRVGIVYDASYATSWTLVYDDNHDLLESQYSSIGTGSVVRLAGSAIRPSRQNTPGGDPVWSALATAFLNNIDPTLMATAITNLLNSSVYDGAIGFIIAEDLIDPYARAWYSTPLDAAASQGYGPISSSPTDFVAVSGGWVLKMYTLARNYGAALVRLVLGGKGNHCILCTGSTHAFFAPLATLLKSEGVLDGVGMAFNLNESDATEQDMTEALSVYSNLGLDIHITSLQGSDAQVSLAVSVCLANPRCVTINLATNASGEVVARDQLLAVKNNWTARVSTPQPGAVEVIRLDSTSQANLTVSQPTHTYRFTLDTTQAITAHTCSIVTDFDTVLTMYSDAALTQVLTRNDDYSVCGDKSLLRINLSPGTYYLQVSGFVPSATPNDPPPTPKYGTFLLALISAADPNQLEVASTRFSSAFSSHPSFFTLFFSFLSFLVALSH